MNISKPKIMTACLMSLCLVSTSACSQAQTPAEGVAQAPIILSTLVEQLSSPDEPTRQQAALGLIRNYAMVRNQLVDNLNKFALEPDKTPDKSFGGQFALLVRVAGFLRVEDAIPPLNQFIGFQLDPKKMPPENFGTTLSYYPVVNALIDIGVGKRWRDEFFRSCISSHKDDATLRASTCVLRETLGNDLAKVLVQQYLTGRVAGMGNTTLGKMNLERVLQLLENGGAILENPELKSRTTPQTPTLPANPGANP